MATEGERSMNASRALIAGVIVTLAVPVSAQSLAELAKKEQERRKAAPAAAKTYTDDDLKKITPPSGAAAPAAPATTADPGGAAAVGDKGKAKADDKEK